MFKFSKEEIDDIKDIAKAAYKETEERKILAGLHSLEQLINCAFEGDRMPDDIGMTIQNNIRVAHGENSNFNITPVEAVFRKIGQILKIKNNNFFNNVLDGVTLESADSIADYYKLLKIMNELQKTYGDINRGRGDKLYADLGNGKVALNRQVWPERQVDYARVWKFRNDGCHYNQLERGSKVDMHTAFFAVMIDVCNRFKKYIEEMFVETFNEAVDFANFKQKLLDNNKRDEFFNKQFTQLCWGKEKDENLWENRKHVLLIGEAGSGKTTQIEKMYWDEIHNVNNQVLPIWVKIQELSNKEDKEENRLIKAIKEALQTRSGWYEELMERGKVTLYLDGLNELIVNDRGESVMALYGTIKKLMEKYPDVCICMTDRSNQIDLDGKNVFSGRGMTEEECLEYCEKNWGADEEKIMEFLNPYGEYKKSNQWLPKESLTPEKVNVIAYMLLKNEHPEDRTDYYAHYVEYILRREYKEKCDPKVEDLMLGLHKFAETKESALDSFSSQQIIDCFTKYFMNISYAKDLYKLACAIPLIEKNGDNYNFVKYAYFDYFKGEVRIENVIG